MQWFNWFNERRKKRKYEIKKNKKKINFLKEISLLQDRKKKKKL